MCSLTVAFSVDVLPKVSSICVLEWCREFLLVFLSLQLSHNVNEQFQDTVAIAAYSDEAETSI